MFWEYLKNLSRPKNLRTLKTNFEEADGLGIVLSARTFRRYNTSTPSNFSTEVTLMNMNNRKIQFYVIPFGASILRTMYIYVYISKCE